MIDSEFAVMNKCLEMINKRIAALDSKKQTLWRDISSKYPADMYGLKGEMMYQKKSEELNHELTIMIKWQKAWWDALDIIEGRNNYD